MSHTEYYEKPCPCKKGKVKWAEYEKWSSWGGIDHFPVEILCPICKKTHEIKTRTSYDRKTGDQYSMTEVIKKK